VNVAHSVQTGWGNIFSSYWKFWLVMSTLLAAALWAIGTILSWIWPSKQGLKDQEQ